MHTNIYIACLHYKHSFFFNVKNGFGLDMRFLLSKQSLGFSRNGLRNRVTYF